MDNIYYIYFMYYRIALHSAYVLPIGTRVEEVLSSRCLCSYNVDEGLKTLGLRFVCVGTCEGTTKKM